MKNKTKPRLRLSPGRRRYWIGFVNRLPRRLQPLYWRRITRFEERLQREYEGWVKVLAREFAPTAGRDPKEVELLVLARDRARQMRKTSHRK